MNPAAFVITIQELPESVKAASDCIESGKAHGIEVMNWRAITPADAPVYQFNALGWNPDGFANNHYSRQAPCMAAFLSHASLWRHCLTTRRPVLICEHDCFFTRPFPTELHDTAWAVNLGKPSYGKFRQPTCGVSPMVHKPKPHYMGGAHCYFVRPQAAKRFLEMAATQAGPTDIFLNLERFPFLRDFFPWIAECREDISTIQAEAGCVAKHRKVKIV